MTMDWTPEQREEIRRQKALNPPNGRLYVTRTPEQVAEWRKLAEAEHTPEAIAANRKHHAKLVTAEEEPGFSGDLRRAISKSRIPIHRLAADAIVDIELLESFRCGEATLPTDVVDRLVATLHLKLTEEVV